MTWFPGSGETCSPVPIALAAPTAEAWPARPWKIDILADLGPWIGSTGSRVASYAFPVRTRSDG